MNRGLFRESAGMDKIGTNCGQLCTHPYACKDGCLRRTGPHPKTGRYAYGAEDHTPSPMTEPAVSIREVEDCALADHVRALLGPPTTIR